MSRLSMYQRVMGPHFDLLPAPLRYFHALQGHHVLNGWVQVQGPASFASAVLARFLGTPLRAQDGELRFELAAQETCETWTRHFPGKTMRSHLSMGQGRLVEQVGGARLAFAVEGNAQGLVMRLVGLRVLGVPCPHCLLPAVVAEESGSPGRLHFRIQASLPLLGRVAGYQGYLQLPDGEAA